VQIRSQAMPEPGGELKALPQILPFYVEALCSEVKERRKGRNKIRKGREARKHLPSPAKLIYNYGCAATIKYKTFSYFFS